ncbi:MAG: hypothetical protein JRJ85_12510 [Deltaproteobacteria bacterium]|nr:hypothetical protein [Deltaproteobacteria bacterium]
MTTSDRFIKAYHEFKKSVDLTQDGILPELDNLVWYMLMGIPQVPADEDSDTDAQLEAIDQRVTILKAVFAEVNRGRSEEFIDRGLVIYDRAAQKAKFLLQDSDRDTESEPIDL